MTVRIARTVYVIRKQSLSAVNIVFLYFQWRNVEIWFGTQQITKTEITDATNLVDRSVCWNTFLPHFAEVSLWYRFWLNNWVMRMYRLSHDRWNIKWTKSIFWFLWRGRSANSFTALLLFIWYSICWDSVCILDRFKFFFQEWMKNAESADWFIIWQWTF